MVRRLIQRTLGHGHGIPTAPVPTEGVFAINGRQTCACLGSERVCERRRPPRQRVSSTAGVRLPGLGILSETRDSFRAVPPLTLSYPQTASGCLLPSHTLRPDCQGVPCLSKSDCPSDTLSGTGLVLPARCPCCSPRNFADAVDPSSRDPRLGHLCASFSPSLPLSFPKSPPSPSSRLSSKRRIPTSVPRSIWT